MTRDPHQAVHQYYDNAVDKEWERLVQDPYHQIEFEVVHRLIMERLAAGSRVVDVGCGPGRRALRLAAEGHQMSLIDISQRSLDHAVAEFARRGLTGKLDAATLCDVRDLELPPAHYDAALVFGPAYHLLDDQDIRSGLERVSAGVREGGHVFIIFLTRISVLKDLVKLGLLDDVDALTSSTYLTEGTYVASGVAAEAYMPSARTFRLTEARALVESSGLEVVGEHSCEGIAAFLKPAVNSLVPARVSLLRLVDTIVPSCGEADVIEAGDHFLLTCRVNR